MRLLILGTGWMTQEHARQFGRIDGSALNVSMGEDIDNGKWRALDPGSVPTNYQRFAEAVRSGVQAEPSFRHAAELQKVLDLAVVADQKRAELSAHADTQ